MVFSGKLIIFFKQQGLVQSKPVADLFAKSGLVKIPSKWHIFHWIVETISLVMATMGCHYRSLSALHKGDGYVLGLIQCEYQ